MNDNLQATPNENPSAARNMADVRRLCQLGPLEDDELRDYFVDTAKSRDPHTNMRSVLRRKLKDNPDKDLHLLVYGHAGAGKSTELTKLQEDLGDEFCTVRFSVEKELNLTQIEPEDIPVVIAERVLDALKDDVAFGPDVLQRIYDWFATTTRSVAEGKDSTLAIGAEAKIGSPLDVLKLLVSLKSELKLNTKREESKVLELRKSKTELLQQVNLFLHEVHSELFKRNQRLLIIVEDLDKAQIANAREIFIESNSMLTGLHATIIYTIPIFTFHSHDAAILENAFDEAVGLQMIKVTEPDRITRAEGFEVVRRIVRRRVPPELLPDDALDLAVEKTGGVLRHLFQVLSTAASMTDDDDNEPLTIGRIRYGLQQRIKTFYREIAVPYGGTPDYPDLKVEELYERLAIHATKSKAGYRIPTDGINQVLLKCCAVVEYNGEGWFGVHPLVCDILHEMGRL